MTTPLYGQTTHPLSEHAIYELRRLVTAPRPRQSMNPGVVNRMLREQLIRLENCPSPYVSAKPGARIEFAIITNAGRKVLTDIDAKAAAG